MKVALVTLGRLENQYAVEWVEYYKKLGIDHIYIIDNNHNGEEYFEDVLQNYIDNNYVTIIDKRNKVCNYVKYNVEIYKKINKDYDWICYFDFDEFLTLEKDNNIKEYLSRECFTNFDQIFINWKIYTDNDLVLNDGRPCLERFITPIQYNTCIEYADKYENEHVKPIIRGGIKNIKMCNQHYFTNNNLLNTTSCNSVGQGCWSTIFIQFNYDLAYLKHFVTKTIDEWITNKWKKFTKDRKNNISTFITIYPLERFFKYNNITQEKLDYLKDKGFNISNINKETVDNWFVDWNTV